MSSVESGRIGPKLVSSPNLQQDENSESICYCPECGARVRVVSREPESDRAPVVGREPEDDADRSTLPDWLPTAGAVPTPTPSDIQAMLPTPLAVPASAAPITPRVKELPLLETRPSLPALPSFPATVESSDDDETTRVVRVSADYGIAPVISTETHVPQEPLRPSEVTRAEPESSSRVELPSPTTADTASQDVQPSARLAIVETAPRAHDYSPPVSVQSTSPTARDISLETDPSQDWQRRPRRTGLLLSVGLGGGALAIGLALVMRGPSPAPTLAAVATPVAAVAASPVQPVTTSQETLPVTEPAEQPASATPAKQSEPKAVRAAAHEIARSEPAAPKTPNAQVTQPSTQQPKDEPDDEEEPFDAREAAHAVDEAAERASSCRREADPSGVAVVTITFAPSGRVTTATLAGPPFIGTPTGSCIASTMRSARVSAFSGKHMTVRKTVTIH
jgi:hypothetical protein